ncbi:NADH-quinone oxidoreductase subunit N [Paenibacillus sp. GCM10023252]|uniref:NADH-quinone oxidoreductase subunit N n=1 Tax=Paenibacillus sp. GCM10023252 TaxID=3252649 RepID=UPI00360F2608
MVDSLTMAPLTWTDMLVLAPELSLAAVMLLLVVLDLALPRQVSRELIGWLSLTGILLSAAIIVWDIVEGSGAAGQGNEIIRLLADSYRVDDFGHIMKLIFLAAAGFIVLLAIGSVKRDPSITDHAEYYYLLLPAVIGAMIMSSSGNLVTLYVGLELLSITTYVLIGLRKRSTKSAEAAFKYVVTGGISSAFILFGMSYLYGVTGSVALNEIAAALPTAYDNYEALVYVGFFFLIAGFAVKIAAAPFHAWAPDVYQGASTPVTAFLAVVSKGAALAVVFRIVYSTAFVAGGGEGVFLSKDVFFTLLVLAAAAMIAGTTAALRQHQMKRLLALSGVANAGYLLVPIGISITIVHSNNFGEFVYYLIAYLFMNIGALAVVMVVSRSAGHEEMSSFAGLYYRAPWTAAAMAVFVLSLAGLPVTGGFLGKLFILLGAASAGAYWLVAIMAASTVVSYYFYFAIIRQMFMRSGEEDRRIDVPWVIGMVIWLCAGVTVAMGLIPGPIMEGIEKVFSIPADLLVR